MDSEALGMKVWNILERCQVQAAIPDILSPWKPGGRVLEGNGSERRRYTRMSTSGEPYEVSFQIHDRLVNTACLANLSAGGCGLEVQMVDAWDLDSGSVLENLCIMHGDIPCVPLQGTVVRLLGKVPGKTSGYVLVGVEFSMITPFVQELIEGHVQARCRQES